jgi:hypothetical protein
VPGLLLLIFLLLLYSSFLPVSGQPGRAAETLPDSSSYLVLQREGELIRESEQI